MTDRLRRLREGAPGLVAAARRRVRPRVPTDQTVPEIESHFVVCGDDALALRLVEELIRVHRSPVTVILPSRQRNHGPQIARIPGIRLIEADRLNTWAFTRARIRTASALALLKQDDVGNMDAALLAQELNPKIRLVIRMFNMSLGHHVRVLLRNCRVLSDASIAAPAFVAAALGEVAPSYVRLVGHTLAVARREDVRPEDVICGLADTSDGGEPVLLPPDEDRCDLVLARASGVRSARLAEAAARGASVAARARLVGRLRRLVGALVSPGLGLTFLGLLALLFGAMVAQWLINPHMSFPQAAYVTLLNTVGGASANLDLSGPEQVLQSVVALTGIAVIPVVTAVVVEAVVNARLAFALGSRRGPVAGHVVVVGLGNLGTRAIQQLHDLGVPVTAIDKAESARGTRLVRELGIPLIIGDASRPETLREASVSTAQALLAVSTDDVANLEAALQGRQMNPELRAVLRLFDGDFADRLQRTFGLTSSKSVSYLAAPAFAAAMQEREVTGTISVKRQVLLVAEIPVQPGSPLDGLTVAEAQRTGEIRVIALANGRTRYTTVSPPPDHRLAAPDDWLIVVATAAGLTRMLAASTVDQKS